MWQEKESFVRKELEIAVVSDSVWVLDAGAVTRCLREEELASVAHHVSIQLGQRPRTARRNFGLARSDCKSRRWPMCDTRLQS